MELSDYFLPYQRAWINDRSPVKIWEKSRRIGATYTQAFEDVRDCIEKRVPAVWYSSADESAAREYIAHCRHWVRALQAVAEFVGASLYEGEDALKQFVIEFANGTKIHALSSNPKALRSKGGKVVLDEFAFHEHPDELWAAAKPVATWGYPLRIISTHNGRRCRFYKFIEAVRNGELPWSLHTTPLEDAVEAGLVDKIYGRPTTREERLQWLEQVRLDCVDEETWLQEYCCVPVDESTAFLTYEMIAACEGPDVEAPLSSTTEDVYVGMDIGRKRDLSVIWVLERQGQTLFTRQVRVLQQAPFGVQREVLFEVLSHRNVRRCCIDASGLGMQLAEEALQRFGKYRVEPITFTPSVKEDLAYNLRRHFEEHRVIIPRDYDIREDLHSVRKTVTTAGHIRFDAERSQGSHADRFWALALALHAAKNNPGRLYVATRMRREMPDILRGYW